MTDSALAEPRVSTPTPAPPLPARERFLVALAKALHRRGVAAPRLENALSTAGAAVGAPVQVLATPTALQLAFETPAGQRVVLVRQNASVVDLDAVATLDETLDAVVSGTRTPEEGLVALEELDRRPPPYGPTATVVAFAAASATAAALFGGAPADLAAASLLGAGVGLGARVASRREAVARLFDPAAAFAVTIAAALPALMGAPLGRDLVALAALIVLLPGYTVTVAMSELAEGHLSAGSSRLFGAGITFLSLGLGVGLAQALLRHLDLPAGPVGSPPQPGLGFVDVVALLLAAIAFGVLFRARRRHLGWIVLAAILGVAFARVGARAVGPELGSFVGALAVGLTGNALARTIALPTMVCHVPGILLLVPGSVGFRSLVAFLSEDVLSGTETAFRMTLVAAALAAGLLLAHVLLPPLSRRRARQGSCSPSANDLPMHP